jgi:hypothetical protein
VSWRGLLCGLALACGVALSGCAQTAAPHAASSTTSAKPSTTGTAAAPVTRAQMAAIVAATMTLNNKANESLDLGLLESYESGSALAIDAASYTESAALPNSACSSLPFSIKVLSEVAEAGSSYPQRFVVLGSSYPLPVPKGCSAASRGSCPDADSIFEFQRSAPGAPWKIALEPSADTGDIVRLSGAGGVVGPLTPADAAAVKGIPPALAGDLEGYEATGRRGSLRAGYFTGSCWLIPDPRAGYEQYAKSGVNAHQVYSPASDEVSVPITGGGALTMFSLDFETTLLPTSADGTIDWISDPSFEPVTALLAAGQYKRVVEKGALQIAAETGRQGAFTVVGAYFGVTSITGTLGSSSQGSGGGGGVLVSDSAP